MKKALGIDTFRNISRDKIMEFVSLIPSLDKDVAMKIINQFPSYIESASTMIAQLKILCDNAIKENSKSQIASIDAYRKILEDLGELLKRDNISLEQIDFITSKMILVADKIAEKDSENKYFFNNIIKYGGTILGGTLLLGAAVLGVNVKGCKIPIIKK